MIQDSLDWFSARQQTGVSTGLETSEFDSEFQYGSNLQQSVEGNFEAQYNLDEMMDLDGLLEFGFDMSLPLMTDAFDSNTLFAQDF